jgi:hypothetical protein
MSHAPKMRARSAVVGSVPPFVQPFANSAAARLLIDVRHTRHESVEFIGNPFFNDLCGQIVREEAMLLAGAPGSNKSTLARQLTLDLVSQGQRALMILTEESAERAKAGFVNMAGEWPQSKVRAALSNIHVETGIHDVEMLPNFFASQVLNPHGPYHGVSLIVLDSIQGPGNASLLVFPYRAAAVFIALDDRDVTETGGGHAEREATSTGEHFKGPHAGPPQGNTATASPSGLRSLTRIPTQPTSAIPLGGATGHSACRDPCCRPTSQSRKRCATSAFWQTNTSSVYAKSNHARK